MPRWLPLLALACASEAADLALGVAAAGQVARGEHKAFLFRYGPAAAEPLVLSLVRDCDPAGDAFDACVADPCGDMTFTAEFVDNGKAVLLRSDAQCEIFIEATALPTDDVYTLEVFLPDTAADAATAFRIAAYSAEPVSATAPQPSVELASGTTEKGTAFVKSTGAATAVAFLINVEDEHLFRIHPLTGGDLIAEPAIVGINADKGTVTEADSGSELEIVVKGEVVVQVGHAPADPAPRCPWLTAVAAGVPGTYQCGNGTQCASQGCCANVGRTTVCPRDLPAMCSDENACGGDYCCVADAAGCKGLTPEQVARWCGMPFLVSLSPREDAGGSDGMSGGAVFLLLLFIACAVYCFFGIAYNCYRGSGGFPDCIPHLHFWREVPSFFVEGVQVCKAKVFKSEKPKPNYSAYRGEYAPAPRDAMGQSASNSAYGGTTHPGEVNGEDDETMEVGPL